MNTSLPSPSTIYGICGAFFLAAAMRAVEVLVGIATSWSRPEIMASVEITSPRLFAWALFGIVVALVGVRLLYDRPHCVLQGLIAGWVILVGCCFLTARLLWQVNSLPSQTTLPPVWMSHAFSAAVPGLFAGVVVCLLHSVRPKHEREASFSGVAQNA